ncbi:MAG: DnaJ domain-containing protein [Deltaproteobacteria bacterium]|nr:DnaJ domain-containing protein [Deltaproteobacteria bacterium]
MDFTADLHMIPVLRGGRLPIESLNAVEKHLLGLVNGRRTVQELGRECGFDAELAGRMVGKFLMAGILEVTANAAATADSTPPGNVSVSPIQNKPRNDETSSAVTEDIIIDFYSRLDNSNYYELLGVSPIADRAEIRAAYFSLSKKFHPDTRFLHGSNELKQKLNRIFDRLTIAYETLSGKSRRHAYDASIASDIELWQLENSLKQSVNPSGRPQAGASDSERPPASAASSAATSGISNTQANGPNSIQPQKPSATSYRRTPVQDDVSIGARPRVSRIPVTRSSYTTESPSSTSTQPATQRPSGSRTAEAGMEYQNVSGPSSFRPSYIETAAESLSPEEREARRQQWKKERLKKAIRTGGFESKQHVGNTLTETEVQLIEHARIAIEQQEFEMAIQCVQEVLRRDGENTLASELLRQAQSGKIKSDINEIIRKGRFEQSSGNYDTALELYETAFKLDTRHLEAKYHVAAILLEMRRETRRAIQLCKEIISMGGRKPQYYTTLADLYELCGDHGRAMEYLHKAVERAPEDRELKKRLRSMTRK